MRIIYVNVIFQHLVLLEARLRITTSVSDQIEVSCLKARTRVYAALIPLDVVCSLCCIDISDRAATTQTHRPSVMDMPGCLLHNHS